MNEVDLEHVDWPDDPRYAPGRHRAHGDRPVRLVVLGDSFCFTDERGPQPPGSPTVWPTSTRDALAERLGVEVELTVLCRPAMTARQALDLLRKDQHAQHDVLAHADAVVLAIGSYDHAPMGIPTPLQELLGHVRPYRLRRRVRLAQHRLYPWLVRLTRARFARTARAEFEREYRRVLEQLRGNCHGAAGAAVGPSSHRSAYYGGAHPMFPARERLQLELAASEGFTPVPAWHHVASRTEQLNVDGIHWPSSAHRLVGRDVADALAAQLDGSAPRPRRPGRAE